MRAIPVNGTSRGRTGVRALRQGDVDQVSISSLSVIAACNAIFHRDLAEALVFEVSVMDLLDE